jgi:hypothetical protein
MLADKDYEWIADGCEDMELNSVWDYFSEPGGTVYLKHNFVTFDSRREALLWIVKRLLEEGRIKLVNMRSHVPLEGSIDEQIQRFRDAFPKSDEEMDNGFWFFSEACPGGSAWQHTPSDK